MLLVIFLVVLGGIFGYKILAAGNKISVAERSILGQLKDLLFNSGKSLKGEKEDRINILLIAIGGEGHSGENLADSIIIASIRPSTGQASLLSIPRDLYVQVPHEDYYSKINAVHAYGEAKGKDKGPALLREEVETVTGIPIHYFARIDFTAFKHIVDAVGGIDITIPNTFFDYWHKISFPAGTEHMNGERALAYVRARYIEGPEGGDFKRAARQQQVLLAIREKVFSASTAVDFTAANKILDSLSDNVRTDMELWEMKRFYELARTFQHDALKSAVLSTGPKGVLVGSTEIMGGLPASILKTRTGDFSEIQAIARDMFSATHTVTNTPAPPESTPTPTAEQEKDPKDITVEIQNGTTINGLAARVRTTIQEKGYTVSAIGNAANRSEKTTVVYILTDDGDAAGKTIAKLLNAKTSTKLPDGVSKSSTDILVIVGEDAT